LAGWRGCWLAGGVVGWQAINIFNCLINFYRNQCVFRTYL
jgi:hypothetical protein